MKDLGSMNLVELKECERNALLSRAQIQHLEDCIKVAENNE